MNVGSYSPRQLLTNCCLPHLPSCSDAHYLPFDKLTPQAIGNHYSLQCTKKHMDSKLMEQNTLGTLSCKQCSLTHIFHCSYSHDCHLVLICNSACVFFLACSFCHVPHLFSMYCIYSGVGVYPEYVKSNHSLITSRSEVDDLIAHQNQIFHLPENLA